METKEQLQKLLTKKWRRIQAFTLFSAIFFGVLAYLIKTPGIAVLSVGTCILALSHEWIIHYYIPEYDCDQLRKELGRK